MRIKQILSLAVFTTLFWLSPSARAQTTEQKDVRLLRNGDVLQMVAHGMKSGDIIAKIVTSPCNFDVFPPVLRDLKRRGVPDTVLLAMKIVPNGPPSITSSQKNIPTFTTQVKVPAKTQVEVEAAFPISSADAKKGDLLTFLTTRQVFVDGLLIINRGAIAKARVVNVKPAAALGRAGMLAWAMEYVEAVDGSRLPLEISGVIKGNNRIMVLAGGALATGALAFPYTSPIALVWGLKKGDEAILRGSKPFLATVTQPTEVAGVPIQNRRQFFHDIETVKMSVAPVPDTPFPRLGIRH
jgi:hypothetical protein